SNSGAFLDIVAPQNQSVVIDANYVIVVPPGRNDLRVAIFDGNCAGLWDQGNPHVSGGLPVADGSVAQYELATNSTLHTSAPVALGESENSSPSAGVTKTFSNAMDSRWEFLSDGPNN